MGADIRLQALGDRGRGRRPKLPCEHVYLAPGGAPSAWWRALAEEERLLRPRKRIGFMRKKRVLGYYVRVDEHGREGEE